MTKKDTLKALKDKCAMYESWLRAIDEYASFDVWFKDSDSRYRYVNRRFEHAMGCTREELLGRKPYDIFDTERADRVVAMDQQVMEHGGLERTIPCDGSGMLQMHQEHRFPVRSETGEIVGLGCFAIEVSQQNFAEEALNQAQSLAKLGSWRWSITKQCLISCSEQFANLLGCSIQEAFQCMHDRVNRIVHPDDRDIVKKLLDKQLNPADCEFYQIEYRIVLPNGKVRHVLEIAEPLVGNNGLPVEYAGTLQDITERKVIEQELRDAKELLEHRVAERTKHLEFVAAHDSLTQLLNRDALQDQFVEQIQSNGGGECAVLMIDLNGFKFINDCYGHPCGDEVLKAIAARLNRAVHSDDLVARFGGDEFAAVLLNLKNR